MSNRPGERQKHGYCYNVNRKA